MLDLTEVVSSLTQLVLMRFSPGLQGFKLRDV